jgi:hypothetical protein
VGSGGPATWVKLAFTFIHFSTATLVHSYTQRLTSMFTQIIHRHVHRTLALHPPGLA